MAEQISIFISFPCTPPQCSCRLLVAVGGGEKHQATTRGKFCPHKINFIKMASGVVRMGRIVLMCRGFEALAKAADFYHQGLGFAIIRITDDWAELRCGTKTSGNDQDSSSINLQAVSSEAQLSTGYSPILSFEVDDMNTVVSRCAQKGGHLDGLIQYPAHGNVATLCAPGGQMIGL